MTFDSTGSYLAISNSDKCVRVLQYPQGYIVCTIRCGDTVTGLLFTLDLKTLIVTTESGSMMYWGLSDEMVRNMQRNSNRLNRLGMLETLDHDPKQEYKQSNKIN
jgi:hypothetical protein